MDSGSAEATADLWVDDDVFDAVGAIRMQGHDEIAAMVNSDGHQGLIENGCGRVLTAPLIALHRDEVRWDAGQDRFWVARVSANSWRWVRTPAGWRTVERVNANLDGTPEHRGVLTPPTRSREAN